MSQLIGHRGASGLAPENTLISFEYAKRLELNWVEFDIQRCQTGEWVVIHDETVDRTTNGRGHVKDIPYSQLQNLDAGSWFDPKFKDERIPLFQDLLLNLKNWDLNPIIEIKDTQANRSEGLLDFLALLEKFYGSSSPLPLTSSFDLETLIFLKSRQRKLPIGFIVEDFSLDALKCVQEFKFFSLHCNYKTLTREHIHQAKVLGIPILAYTVNDQTEIQRLLKEGVTAVFSDMTYFFNSDFD